MKNKVHYIITVLLTITCIYLAWQLQGVKEYIQVQSKLNDAQGDLNETVYEHIERLYRK